MAIDAAVQRFYWLGRVELCLPPIVARFPAVRMVHMPDTTYLPAQCFEAILRDAWPELEHLALMGTGVGLGAADALLPGGVPRLSRLQSLRLDLSSSSVRLSNAILQAGWPLLERLLLVQRGPVDGTSAEATQVPHLDPAKLPMLRLLRLENIRFGDAGLRALAHQVWPALEECSLPNCSITESGAAALAVAGAAHFQALRVLDLSGMAWGMQPRRPWRALRGRCCAS